MTPFKQVSDLSLFIMQLSGQLFKSFKSGQK